MRQWHEVMAAVLADGEPRSDRTGVGTQALFGRALEFDLREGFPAVTTKRLGFGQVRAELAAFLAGAQSLAEFHEKGCSIWDANGLAPYWRPKSEGDLGRIYGVQWRRWRSCKADGGGSALACRETDQLANLVAGLRRDPHGRRHLVTAWNPGELDDVCLPACHVLFQAYASDGAGAPGRGWLDLAVYMRSVDLFIGLPFDVASYALLQHLICRSLGDERRPRHLRFFLGDAHVYRNHEAQAVQALSRGPLALPRLALADGCPGVLGFEPGQAWLEGYECHAAIAAPMNV